MSIKNKARMKHNKCLSLLLVTYKRLFEYTYRYFNRTKYKGIAERALALPEILVFPIHLSLFLKDPSHC